MECYNIFKDDNMLFNTFRFIKYIIRSPINQRYYINYFYEGNNIVEYLDSDGYNIACGTVALTDNDCVYNAMLVLASTRCLMCEYDCIKVGIVIGGNTLVPLVLYCDKKIKKLNKLIYLHRKHIIINNSISNTKIFITPVNDYLYDGLEINDMLELFLFEDGNKVSSVKILYTHYLESFNIITDFINAISWRFIPDHKYTMVIETDDPKTHIPLFLINSVYNY